MNWKWPIFLIASAIAIYALWQWNYPSGSIRYKLTIEVEADGRTYTGSGVLEVGYAISPRFIFDGVTASLKGEAIVVMLGSRAPLVVLLEGAEPVKFGKLENYRAEPTNIPAGEFFGASVGSLSRETIQKLGSFSIRKEIPTNRLPRVVKFDRIDDPDSVKLVRMDELQSTHGPGILFRRATLETTHDVVTRGIEKTIKWVGDQQSERRFLQKLFDLGVIRGSVEAGAILKR